MKEQNEQQIQYRPSEQKFHLNKRLLIIIGSIFAVINRVDKSIETLLNL